MAQRSSSIAIAPGLRAYKRELRADAKARVAVRGCGQLATEQRRAFAHASNAVAAAIAHARALVGSVTVVCDLD
jgi:hypothetical protein